MKLAVAGVASDPNKPAAKNWTDCLEYLDLEYHVLGANMDYKHNGVRGELNINFLKNTDADIVIFTDVYDVIPNKLIKDIAHSENKTVEEYILDIFLSYNSSVVVGGERLCSPGYCYEFSGTNLISNEHKFPNAGMLIGYREVLLDMYLTIEDCVKENKIGYFAEKHDQYRLGYYMQHHPEHFYIEKCGKLFNNHYMYDFNKKRNSDRRRNAVFSHYPGMSAYTRSTKSYNEFARDLDLQELDYKYVNCDLALLILIIVIAFIIVFIIY